MNPHPKPAAPDTPEAAASQWLARRDRALSSREQDEYLQWLRQDPRNGQAIARLEKAWGALDALARWRPKHSAHPNPDLLAARKPRRAWLYASVFAAAAAGIFAFILGRAPLAIPAPPIVAETYERRALPDGSVVELNHGAEIAVRFTPGERRVELTRGEANFTVAKNPARPFVVHAGKVEVHAVGTVFNVALKADAVEVIVTEGKVRVDEPLVPARQLLNTPLLVAGQRAVISTAGPAPQAVVAAITPQQISQALAWQPAHLEFTDMPLVEIVAEFNRHNSRQLIIGDPELGELRVGGNFRADNAEGFVRLLEAGFGVEAKRLPGEIILRRAR